jgi:hypothetical protein
MTTRRQLLVAWGLFALWFVVSALLARMTLELLRPAVVGFSPLTARAGLMLIALLSGAASLVALYFAANAVASTWFGVRSLKDWFLLLNDPLWRGDGWWR